MALLTFRRSPASVDSHNATIRQLKCKERKLTYIIRQINILNDRIRGLNYRIQAARRDGNHCFRYSLRMRIGVSEGVRNMMYKYARDLVTEIALLRRLLYNQYVHLYDDSDEDEPAADDQYELVDDDDTHS